VRENYITLPLFFIDRIPGSTRFPPFRRIFKVSVIYREWRELLGRDWLAFYLPNGSRKDILYYETFANDYAMNVSKCVVRFRQLDYIS